MYHDSEICFLMVAGSQVGHVSSETQSSVSPLVTTRDFPAVALVIRSLKNSVLLSFKQRNCFQFLGIRLDNSTRLRFVELSWSCTTLFFGLCFKTVVKILVPHNVYSLSLIMFLLDVGNKHLCSVVTKCLAYAGFENADECHTIHDAYICSWPCTGCRLHVVLKTIH